MPKGVRGIEIGGKIYKTITEVATKFDIDFRTVTKRIDQGYTDWQIIEPQSITIHGVKYHSFYEVALNYQMKAEEIGRRYVMGYRGHALITKKISLHKMQKDVESHSYLYKTVKKKVDKKVPLWITTNKRSYE